MSDAHPLKPAIVTIAPELLMVDPAVQRDLDPRRVTRMAENLDLDAVGVLTVSLRTGGEMAIVDGQHRRAALLEAGRGAIATECKLFRGLALQQEAALFRLLNATSKPSAIDLFRVRVVEGEEVAVGASRLIESFGWRISLRNNSEHFGAVVAFERIFRRDPAAAGAALGTVTKAWGHDRGGADGRLIEGLGLVFLRYGDALDGAFLSARFAKQPGGAAALIGKARGLASMLSVTVPQAVAEVTVGIYNHHRRRQLLPPWRSE